MKLYLIFIWLALASQINLSAQNYFSKVYESDTASITFSAIISKENSLYAIGRSQSATSNMCCNLLLFHFDLNGELISSIVLDSSYTRMGVNHGGRGLVEISENGYLFSYSKEEFNGGNTFDAYIIRFNLDGQVSWINNYGYNPGDPEALWSISPLGENYVLTGWNGEGGIPESYIWYLMINSDGEVLWEKIHYYNDTYTLGIDGYVTRDKEILLGGSTGPSLNETEVYYAKADSMGNIIWEFTYGTEDQNDGQCFMRPFYNENLIMCGSTNGYYLYLREVSPQGNLLHSIPYQEGLVYMGNFVNDFDYTSFDVQFPLVIGHKDFGSQINQMSIAYFNKLLIRTYEKELTIDPLYNNNINDFRKTPTDNGYIACGWIDTYPNYSKGWIMKMDSLGNTCNGFPNCDTTMLIPNTNTAIEAIATHHPLILSPNPVTNELHYTIDCNDCGIAENVLIEIYDLTGKLIACDPSPAMMGDNTMDTSAWPSGMYIIALSTDGQMIHNQRLIKQ
jgi:hypothetical protein